jgi:hypothetical protein
MQHGESLAHTVPIDCNGLQVGVRVMSLTFESIPRRVARRVTTCQQLELEWYLCSNSGTFDSVATEATKRLGAADLTFVFWDGRSD